MRDLDRLIRHRAIMNLRVTTHITYAYSLFSKFVFDKSCFIGLEDLTFIVDFFLFYLTI